jgi:hypothetical protein
VQKLLEKMNSKGVMYKPAAAAADVPEDEDADSFENGPQQKKEFMYKEDSCDSVEDLGPVMDDIKTDVPKVSFRGLCMLATGVIDRLNYCVLILVLFSLSLY